MSRRSPILLLTILAGLASLAWSPPQRIDRKPSNYVCHVLRLAIGPSGVEHVVWTESPEGNRYVEKVVYSRHDGDTWSLPVNISRDLGYLRCPAILIDGASRPMVVWSEEGSSSLRYVRQQDDTWTLPRFCFSARGITPALGLDGSGQVHLLFEEFTGQGGIWHSRYEAECDSWTLPLRVDSCSEPLGSTDAATDLGGRLHAVWQSWGTHGLCHARFDGDTWTTPASPPDPDSASFSVRPRLSVGVDGAPHVVWEERSEGYWIYYSHLCDDTWSTPLRLSTGWGFRPDIFVDRLDRVHAVWKRDSGIAYACCENGVWSEPLLVVPDSRTYRPAIDGMGGLLRMIWGQSNCLWYREHELAGVEEKRPTACSQQPTANICRTVLMYRPTADSSQPTAELLDITGRRVMDLQPGENDIRHLAPGVYFVRRPETEDGRPRTAVRKVVIQR